MDFQTFRTTVRLGQVVTVNKLPYTVKQITNWKKDTRSFTTVVFDGDWFMMANPVHDGYFFGNEAVVPVSPPYPKQLFFQGKQFEVVRSGSAVVEESFGEGPFAEDLEVQMDVYEAADGSVLRLQRYEGRNAFDVVGKEVPQSWVKIQG